MQTSQRTLSFPSLLCLLSLLWLSACGSTQQSNRQAARAKRLQPPQVSDEIIVCGERFSTFGAPVVLWNDRGGFNAYNTQNHFPNTKRKSGKRYTPGRAVKQKDGSSQVLVPASSKDPRELAKVVDQFVLHYDVCGASERCFMVLHDDRELSVQFLIDVDGTIFQTMDVRDQAWHAGHANTRSVGVEIAQIGAYPTGATETLNDWYKKDALGPFVSLDKLEPWHVRTAGFIARPRDKQLATGTINGTEYQQYDFTKEQYRSLVKLTAALNRALPGIQLNAPRDASGAVRSDVLSDAEYANFRGVLGHYHVSENKQDPGPAFDWERFLLEVRAEATRP